MTPTQPAIEGSTGRPEVVQSSPSRIRLCWVTTSSSLAGHHADSERDVPVASASAPIEMFTATADSQGRFLTLAEPSGRIGVVTC
jgi:hypothetical protein